MSSDEYSLDLPKCNCGRPGRYSVSGSPDFSEMSCNKYAQCPPYSELEKNAGELFKDFMGLMSAFEDLRNFKEGTRFSNLAIAKFDVLREKYNIK
jgi:hypothetical protein